MHVTRFTSCFLNVTNTNIDICLNKFSASDEELFEDNPEEYIRRDIEGSDVDTRRRAACDLVKVLSRFFEEKMMQIFGQYVQVRLTVNTTFTPLCF